MNEVKKRIAKKTVPSGREFADIIAAEDFFHDHGHYFIKAYAKAERQGAKLSHARCKVNEALGIILTASVEATRHFMHPFGAVPISNTHVSVGMLEEEVVVDLIKRFPQVKRFNEYSSRYVLVPREDVETVLPEIMTRYAKTQQEGK